MIPVTNAFKNSIANDNRNYIIKIDMTLNDGTELTLHNSDIWNGGLTFEEATSSTSSFDIGAVVIGKCQIVLNNIYDKFTEYDFFNATFVLYLGMQLGETTEIIRKGFYTVDEPKYNGSLITLSCLDNMWKFDTPYAEVSTAYPAAIGAIIADICAHCGVALGKADFPNYNYVIMERPDGEMNCREVISYLAQISCLYARISREGMLVMQWYDKYPSVQNVNGGYFDDGTPLYKSGDDLYGGTFDDWNSGDDYDGGTFEDWEKIHVISSTQSMSVSTDDIAITGIRLSSDSDGYDVLCGTEEYVLVIKDNPFVNIDNAEEVAQYVGAIIIGMCFRPFTASVLNDVTIEAGDMCIINDFRGNVYYSYITNLAFAIGNYESLSCGAETPSRNKTVRYSESAKTAVQIKREAQVQISNYDKAVQNMNQLAMNAMGFFASTETLEDGSAIAYLHNKPTREESSTIYKMTSDGFFVSRDGGESYTSGFDAEGNAVLNMLSVIGIQFDWARGGTISLGGENNKNGQLFIFDQNNNQVGQIDNAGIAFYSAVTQTQFILSPIFGLIQRDAEGNEYNGFIYDDIVRVSKPEEIDIEYSHEAVCRNYCEVSLDNQIIITDVDMIVSSMTTTYRRYKYSATRHSIYWGSKLELKRDEEKWYIDIELPARFHGKDWLVLLIFDGWNNDIEDFQYTRIDRYGSNIPDVYDGQQWIDNYYAYYESSMFPATGNDFRLGTKTLYSMDYNKNESSALKSYGNHDSSGNLIGSSAETQVISHMTAKKSIDIMTPDYGATVSKSITTTVSSVYNKALSENTLSKPTLSYEILDEGKTTLRVYCNASVGDYNISQMANIRVIISA